MLPRPFHRLIGIAAIAACLLAVGQSLAAEDDSDANLNDIFRRLGSDAFNVRESAQLELQELATGDEQPALERALDKYLETTDPEVKVRLRSAMFNAIAANARRRGFIGISMDIWGRASPDAVLVLGIIPGSAAEKSGIMRGDEIVALDGKPFQRHDPAGQLKDYVTAKTQGDDLKLSIRRGGRIVETDIELGGMPDNVDPAYKEKAFDDWMHSELVERGLAEPRPTIMPRPQSPVPARPPGIEPRFIPAPRIVPIPKENLLPVPE